jgi:DNA (cytosine-5)-methyltransferase 1
MQAPIIPGASFALRLICHVHERSHASIDYGNFKSAIAASSTQRPKLSAYHDIHHRMVQWLQVSTSTRNTKHPPRIHFFDVHQTNCKAITRFISAKFLQTALVAAYIIAELSRLLTQLGTTNIANLKRTFLDLFCGCGGFSLGMERAEFQCLAAIDFNPEAVKVFKANFAHVPCALEKDLTQFTPQDLEKIIRTRHVDVIVGGPPCQGFSQARQRDGANHGPRMIDDPRRHLYQRFLAFVEYFKPKVFVMENVLGIRSASGGEYFTRVQAEGRKLGYRVTPREEDATKLGVPQNRKRQLFIGIRLDVPGYLANELQPAPRAKHWVGVTLGDAIMDLPIVRAGGGAQEMEYDMERRADHVGTNHHHFIYKVLQVKKAVQLTAHDSRPHSERDLRDFALLHEGENCKNAMLKRGLKFEFPYDKTSFKDRYTRQSRFRPCSTIVAHLSKDGLMFIHPTQNRSLTPREAARVQTFPDWFQFPVTRTHQFRVIGNAVPPLVGEAVGHAVSNLLRSAARLASGSTDNLIAFPQPSTIPASQTEALQHLSFIASLTTPQLRKADTETFLKGWHALLYLFPGLDPENAFDHGYEQETQEAPVIESVDLSQRYLRSGWPVSLEPLGKEAWRRYDAQFIGEGDLYCAAAQRAGVSAA